MKLAILGAGGFAREVCGHLFGAVGAGCYERPEALVFVDDVSPVATLEFSGRSFAVVKNWGFDGSYQFLVAVGDPRAKVAMVSRALGVGLVPAPSLVHPRALLQDVHLGVGGVVTPGVVATTNVTIGDYVIVNLNATIGHDSVVGDYTTVNPGCSISGNTHLGARVFLGTGAVTRERCAIAEDVVVGAQAAVLKDVTTPGVTLVGVPARPLIR